MEEKDYYEILGISRNATKKEIEVAYRKKAKEYHPDRNKSPDATEKMQEINKAYEVLSDPQKKEMYDKRYSNNTYEDTTENYYDDEDDDYYNEEERTTFEEIKSWFKEKHDGWLEKKRDIHLENFTQWLENFGDYRWWMKIYGNNIRAEWFDDDEWFEKEYCEWLNQFDSWLKNINDKYVEEWSKKNYWEWRQERWKTYSSYQKEYWQKMYYNWLTEQYSYWIEWKHKVQEKYFQWLKSAFAEWEIKNSSFKWTNNYYWWLAKANHSLLKNSYMKWLERSKQDLAENQMWLNTEDERLLTQNYFMWLKKYNYYLLLKEVDSKWFKKKNFSVFLKIHKQSFEYEKKLWLKKNYDSFIIFGDAKALKKSYNEWLTKNYNKWRKDTNLKKKIEIPYGVISSIFWLNCFVMICYLVSANIFLFTGGDADGVPLSSVAYICQLIFFILFLLFSALIIINKRKELSKSNWIWMIIYTLIVIITISFTSQLLTFWHSSTVGVCSFIFSIICFIGYWFYIPLSI